MHPPNQNPRSALVYSTPFHLSHRLTRLLLMSEGGGFSLAKPFRFLNTCSSLSKSLCSITTASSPFSSSWSNQVSSSSSSARASLRKRLLTWMMPWLKPPLLQTEEWHNKNERAENYFNKSEHPSSKGCALDNRGWSGTEGKSCFSTFLTSSSSSGDINTYGGMWDGRSTSSRDTLSVIAKRFLNEYLSLFAAWTIFPHIYFGPRNLHHNFLHTKWGNDGGHQRWWWLMTYWVIIMW